MIGYLKGKILSKKPTQVLLDVNGVGYLVNITISTFEKLGNVDDVASLFTYLNVREDDLSLFGFLFEEDKSLFEQLISINGIGPKLALGMLSGISAKDLINAIGNHDVFKLTSIPGVGKKTAERLIIELKDKIGNLIDSQIATTPNYGLRKDAISALVNLGFNSKKVEKITSDLISANPDISIEELIKKSIPLLNK